ncbi:MAG: hypothetical protein H0U57_14785 [Tatlockia sp.]|nr:hypothetical protein [Tatlockia sp.]
MFVVRFRSFLLNVKDTFQSVLLFVRSNALRLRSFNTSPWGLVLKTIFSLTLLVLVLLQAYNLYQSKQHGLDKVLPLFASLSSALLNNTSTFGGIIASAMHTTFLAGPWVLLASMIIGFSQQFGMFLFHSYKAFKSWPDSIERMHHLQAAMNNVFNAVLIISMMMTIVFALLIPGTAPVALATFTVIGVGMLAANFIWRNISHRSRIQLKQMLGFGKPDDELSDEENSIKINSESGYRKKPLPTVDQVSRQVKGYLRFWSPESEDEDTNTELLTLNKFNFKK